MVRTSVPSRVLSVALTIALCCTMVPAENLAFANETNAASEQGVQNSAQNSEASTDAQANGAASESGANSAASAATNRVNEDVAIVQSESGTQGTQSAQSAQAAQNVQTQTAQNVQPAQSDGAQATQNALAQDANATTGSAASNSDIEITRTSVNLLADQATTVFAYNGLMFAVNPPSASSASNSADAVNTASCIGWTGTAPEGALQIPAQVVAAGATYVISGVNFCGGGCKIQR